MNYQYRHGAHVSGVDAQTVGEVCAELEAQHRLTAKDLVEESRPEDAPLHKCFDWNDTTAAEKYREQQARCIIGSVEVVVLPAPEPVRAFLNVERESPKYRSIQAILSDPDDTERMYRTALRELQAFRRKYSNLSQLTPLFEQIDKLVNRKWVEDQF